MALSEIITSTIQAGTVNPARAGFGIPLFLSGHTRWTDGEVRSYTSFSGVAADFEPEDPAYHWASLMFSQNPRPAKIKIGQMAAYSVGQSTVLTFADMASGSAIAGSVVSPDGTVTTLSVAWNTNIATTLAALETAIEAISGIASATVASTTVTVLATAGAGLFHFSFSTVGVHVRDNSADLGYATALDAALVRDPEFFAVEVECNSAKNMDKVARWALANDRFAFFAPQVTKPSQLTSSDFTSADDLTSLQANDAAVFLVTKQRRLSPIEAGWTGRMLPLDPGSATWAYKRIAGVGGDAYTSTERAAIETLHGNHYVAEAGVPITRPGKTAGGEWIDVVIGLAWLEARLQEGLYADLLNNDKIPYTDAGFAILVARVRAVLQEAQDRSILAPGWTVTVRAVADQADADRASRIVRDLEYQATLAGAVHTINLIGTVSA